MIGPASAVRTVVFTALLDGKAIGEHRDSTTTGAGGAQRLHGGVGAAKPRPPCA